ncbi:MULTISPECIES: ESPR-type extended signal peptide-containing protein [Stenotrophomonas]|uniref:ESPR-type extended signal peptide-containing protein n=1 Tax=Stenotrophomonas TaxID=40323 RepID=UPI0018D3352A|nr:ESPR-type extended signal peptide-containing protein [Stenotrophomonas sp.]MBH1509512.1 YadA-like family protein [Stenotrophomonas maltophilia]
MNRIYRRIWNATRQCWVVASELSSPRGKPAQTRVLMSALLLTTAGGAFAANETDDLERASESSAGTLRVQKELIPLLSFAAPNSVASAIAPRGRYDQLAIVMSGNYADAIVSGADVLALGSRANISGTESTGLGNYAKTTGGYATAIGHNARAYGGHGTALGTASYANGKGATALGHDAQATSGNAIAIGSGARAAYTDSVAIGANSVAYESRTVSVGNSGQRRRITNVDAGQSGNDAVNVNQLNNTNRNVSTVEGIANTARSTANTAQSTANTARDTANTARDTANGVRDTANSAKSIADAVNKRLSDTTVKIGAYSSADKADGVAVGAYAAAGLGGVALGRSANSLGDRSVAVGNGAAAKEIYTSALGNMASASGIGASAVGYVSSAEGSFSTSIGYGAKTRERGAVALGHRAESVHEGSVALGNEAQTNGSYQVSVGNATQKRKLVNMSDGLVAQGSSDAITGNQLYATNATATGAKAAADSAVAQVKASSYLLVNGTAGSDTTKAKATGTGALANGIYTEASGTAATAMGRTAKALAEGAIAIGDRAGVESATSKHSIAIGTMAKTGPQEDLLAIGRNANASGGVGAMALGYGSTASHLRSVALGSGSTTSAQDQVSVGNASIKRKIVNVANGSLTATSNEAVTGAQLFATDQAARGAESTAKEASDKAVQALAKASTLEGLVSESAPTGNVRLGGANSGSIVDVRNSTGSKRRISGLADGELIAGGADAVNGGQLFATDERAKAAHDVASDVASRVADVEAQSMYSSVGAGGPGVAARAGLVGVAIGDSAQASLNSEGAVALGSFTNAAGMNSVALGRAARVTEYALSGFALGASSAVDEIAGLALGAASSVKRGAVNSVAIGAGAVADEARTASFGTIGLERRLVHIARGTADHNATTVGQLNDSLATLGGGAKLDANGNVIAPTYTVQNTRQRTVGDALTVLDNAVVRSTSRMDGVEGELRSIFQERVGVQSNGINTVALAGLNGALLTNLADGRIAAGSRDAVTGNQLFAAEQKIERNRSELDALQRDRGSEQLREFAASHAGNTIDFDGARLTGVADARLTTDSSDAVRGSQLHSTNLRLNVIEDRAGDSAFGWLPEGSRNAAAAGLAGVAIGRNAEASLQSEGGVALGSWAKASGKNSVALGRAADVGVNAERGFALGVFSVVDEYEGVALGAGSIVRKGAVEAVAVGAGSIAEESNTVSFGSTAMNRRLVHLASGTLNHNAATVGQLRSALSGFGAEVDSDGNIIGPQFNVQGSTQSTLNDALTTLDGAVLRTTSRVDGMEGQLRSIFQDTATARADGFNQLTLAGAQGMVISNVANGLIAAGSREAVNGGQLHAVQQQLNGRIDGLEQRVDGQGPTPQSRAMALASTEQEAAAPTPPATQDDKVVADTGNAPKSSPAPQPKAEAPESPKPQVDTAELEKMLARANDYSDGIAREVDARLNKMDKRFNRMAAMSSAQTAMAMNTAGLATYNRLGAGVGYAEGESAMAVGYQRVLNDKGSATFSLNGAFTNSGERSVGVGVGIGW